MRNWLIRLQTNSLILCPAENILSDLDASMIDRRFLLWLSLLISLIKDFNISNDKELRDAGSFNWMVLT